MTEIVLSGLSGRFPECSNVTEFWENLLSGVDMVTEDERRWKPGKYVFSVSGTNLFLCSLCQTFFTCLKAFSCAKTW